MAIDMLGLGFSDKPVSVKSTCVELQLSLYLITYLFI